MATNGTNVGSIYYEVDADTSKLLSSSADLERRLSLLEKRLGKTDQAMAGLSTTANSLGGSMTAAASAAKTFISVVAMAGVVKQFAAVSDAVTSMQIRLRLATDSAAEAEATYNKLYTIAQSNRVSFVDLGDTYSSLAQSTKDLGISNETLLSTVESISAAMAIGGGSAESQRAALVQLSQAMASGTLRGDELNSVLEQAPRLARAIADGLRVNIGQLRAMGAAGQITAQDLINALQSQHDTLTREVANAQMTVGQATTQLGNAVAKAVGDFNEATGASNTFASAVSGLASAVSGLGDIIRQNEGTFKIITGGLAGAAAVAGLAAVASRIGAVGTALTGLARILAGNPIVATLLGLGTAAGAVVAHDKVFQNTQSGIKDTIDRLTRLQGLAEGRLNQATLSGDNQAIAKAKADLTALSNDLAAAQKRLATIRQGAGAGRGNINPKSVVLPKVNTSAWDAATDNYLTKREKMEKEIAAAREAGAKAGKSDAEIEDRITRIREKYKDTTKKTTSDAEKAATKARREAEALAKQQNDQAESYIKNLQNTVDKQAELNNYEKLEADIKRGTVTMTAEQQAKAEGLATAADMQKEADQARAAALEAQTSELDAQNQLLQQQREYDAAMLSYGVGDKEASQLQTRIQLMQQYADAISRLNADRTRALAENTDDSRISTINRTYDSQIALQRKTQATALAMYDAHVRDMQAVKGRWELGFMKGWANYVDSAKDTYTAVAEATSSAMTSMTDAVTSFVTTGKASFGDFVTNVLQGLVRIAVQKAMVGLGTMALGSFATGFANVVGATGGDAISAYGMASGAFASGGYTGPGGKYQPAGVVHAGEYVLSQKATKQLGTGFLDRLNGYASGGYVGGSSGKLGVQAAGGSGMQVTVNNYGDNQVQTRETSQQMPDGSVLKNLVIDIIKSDIASGGQTARQLKARYGLREAI